MKDRQSREAFLTSPTPFIYDWCGKNVQIAESVESGETGQAEVEGYDIIELKSGRFVKGSMKISATLEQERRTYFFVSEENRTRCSLCSVTCELQ